MYHTHRRGENSRWALSGLLYHTSMVPFANYDDYVIDLHKILDAVVN